MARKNMDILVGNILGDATIQPQEKNDKTDVTSQEKQNTPQSPKNNKVSPKEDQWQQLLLHLFNRTCWQGASHCPQGRFYYSFLYGIRYETRH